MALGKTASSYEDQGLIALMGPSDALECQGLDVSVVGESWCPALSVASRGGLCGQFLFSVHSPALFSFLWFFYTIGLSFDVKRSVQQSQDVFL